MKTNNIFFFSWSSGHPYNVNRNCNKNWEYNQMSTIL